MTICKEEGVDHIDYNRRGRDETQNTTPSPSPKKRRTKKTSEPRLCADG